MKLKYLIYTITLTSLTACSDFLEPKSQSKYIPKDANALQEMLIGEAYPQQGNTKFLAYLEILADDIDQNQVEGYEFPEMNRENGNIRGTVQLATQYVRNATKIRTRAEQYMGKPL